MMFNRWIDGKFSNYILRITMILQDTMCQFPIQDGYSVSFDMDNMLIY